MKNLLKFNKIIKKKLNRSRNYNFRVKTPPKLMFQVKRMKKKNLKKIKIFKINLQKYKIKMNCLKIILIYQSIYLKIRIQKCSFK